MHVVSGVRRHRSVRASTSTVRINSVPAGAAARSSRCRIAVVVPVRRVAYFACVMYSTSNVVHHAPTTGTFDRSTYRGSCRHRAACSNA
ncbi:hypothetical protein WG70_12765 [Burkholderia oklahomensis EO147]|nr:hypothetical protein WG70_12765 [Burkholderia oklahomensis EO147]AOI50034.1 hypothetical protein WI23_30560 [Burkholderia oklahomensis C6786]